MTSAEAAREDDTMYAVALRCTQCHAEYDLSNRYSCKTCGGILDVQYDYVKLREDHVIEEIIPPAAAGIWRYRLLLPFAQGVHIISLAEGGTPLLRSENLSGIVGADNLYLKDETRNASGAFKDRPISVAVSKAVELGCKAVTAASSGNAAASLSAYAAKARLPCVIFLPEGTPIAKVAQAVTCGAHVIKVRGDYSNSYKMAKTASARFSWMNITTTFINPYSFEGDKTVAYEIFRQMGNVVPDWILVPTGAGPLTFGIHKGFSEIKSFGLSSSMPRIAAVQAEGCKPIVVSFEKGLKSVKAWESVRTVASAIGDPLRGYEKDGELVLSVLKECKGIAVAVGDDDALRFVRELASREGVYAEPASATTIAALEKLIRNRTIKPDEKVVSVITGHGLKDPLSAVGEVQVPVIDPEEDALVKLKDIATLS